MNVYTYTMFDANPVSSGDCVWPHHRNVKFYAMNDEEARKAARAKLIALATECRTEDGYSVGQVLHMLVRNAEGYEIAHERHELTTDDCAL